MSQNQDRVSSDDALAILMQTQTPESFASAGDGNADRENLRLGTYDLELQGINFGVTMQSEELYVVFEYRVAEVVENDETKEWDSEERKHTGKMLQSNPKGSEVKIYLSLPQKRNGEFKFVGARNFKRAKGLLAAQVSAAMGIEVFASTIQMEQFNTMCSQEGQAELVGSVIRVRRFSAKSKKNAEYVETKAWAPEEE